jgi:hypothetical protein
MAPGVSREAQQLVCVCANEHQVALILYFEDAPGAAISGQATHQRRGAADRGEYRQAAGAVNKPDGMYNKVGDL